MASRNKCELHTELVKSLPSSSAISSTLFCPTPSSQTTSIMTSHGPGSCCYVGVKHEGTAKGEMKSIGDVEAYFSYPKDKSTEKGILIVTDVIGHKFINVQLIADQLAENGYFVVMPDVFYGDPVQLNRPGDFDLQRWLTTGGPKGNHLPLSVDPVIDAALVEMRTKYGCKKIGAVGYCFGAKYVVRHLRPDHGKIDVGYCAHPSFVEKDELEAIKGPLAISAAGEVLFIRDAHEC